MKFESSSIIDRQYIDGIESVITVSIRTGTWKVSFLKISLNWKLQKVKFVAKFTGLAGLCRFELN